MREWFEQRWPSLAVVAALIGLVAWSFYNRYDFLSLSPYPMGIDGYFYPVQLRSLLDTGSLYYASSPLSLYFMAPFAAATDPITGAKIGAALGGALLIVPVYFLGRRVSGDRAVGLLASTLIVTSLESFYLTTEFVKNGIGLTVAASYVCVLLWALDAPSRRRFALAAAALGVTALTHKMALAVAVLASVPPLIAAVPDWRDRRVRVGLIAAGAGLVALVALGVIFPDRFIGPGDLGLFSDLFRSSPDFSMPALAPPRVEPLRLGNEVGLAAVLAIAAIVLHVAARKHEALRNDELSRHDAVAFVGFAAFAVFAAIPFLDVSDPQSLGFRVRLMAFVPLAVCAAAAAGRALRFLTPTMRAVVILPFCVGWMASRPAQTTQGTVVTHPAMASAVRALDGVVPADHVVIVPERHIAFMAAWYTDSYVRLRPEPVPPERRWRMLPLNLMSPTLRKTIDRVRNEHPEGIPLPRGLHPSHPNGLVLMPEVTWQWVLDNLPEGPRRHYTRWVTI